VNLKTTILSGLLLIAASLPAVAQTKSPISEINSYTVEVDRFIKTNKKHRIFADTATEDDKGEIWKEFKTDKEVEDVGVYSSASVWTRNGKIAAVQAGFSSPSGDWMHYVNYYFREDGSLARIHAQLNTFYGNVSIVRDRYYSQDGKLLKSTKRILDLETQKPKRKSADFFDNPVRVYLKVSALPFHKLL
jgi:hypothetical protein